MSSETATYPHREALESFKRAVLHGDDAGYPDSVYVVPALDYVEDDFLRLAHKLSEGMTLLFVSDDGAEMKLEVHRRAGALGALDRLRGRTRLRSATRGPFRDAATERTEGPEHDVYVHMRRPAELRRFVPAGC